MGVKRSSKYSRDRNKEGWIVKKKKTTDYRDSILKMLGKQPRPIKKGKK